MFQGKNETSKFPNRSVSKGSKIGKHFPKVSLTRQQSLMKEGSFQIAGGLHTNRELPRIGEGKNDRGPLKSNR